MSESCFYFRFPTEVQNRLDENFNNPLFDKINVLLSKSKYDFIKLGDLLEPNGIVSGRTPKGLHYQDEGISFLGASNINFGSVSIESATKINREIHNTVLKYSQIHKHDVLVSIAGTIGRCAVYDSDNECNCNQAVTILRVNKDKINPFYLVEYLNSEIGQLFFNKLQHISSQPNINQEELKEIIIINPDDIDTQTEILKELKLINNEIQHLIGKEPEIIEEKNITFLKFLGVDQFKLKSYDYYSCDFDKIDRMDFVFNNPQYKILQEIFSKSKFKFEDINSHVIFHNETINPLNQPEKEFDYIDIGNIDTKLGKINTTKMFGREMKSSRMRRLVKEGWVLVSTTRPTRKAITIVPNELEGQICSTGFAVMECKPDILNKFLFFFLRTKIATLQFEMLCSGSGYPAINQDVDLPKIKIPIPSVDKQAELAKEFEELYIGIDRLNNEILEKGETKQHKFKRLIFKEI